MFVALCFSTLYAVYISTDVKRDRDQHGSNAITRTKEAEVMPR
jgi:hypothetical protein